MTSFQQFKQLHEQPKPLLLANAWDAGSAITFEKLGFQAVGTSSAALANALGYPDGENIPFSELLFVAGRIRKSVNLPVTVDIEGGFGESPSVVADHIQRLAELGIAGINIEDSVIASRRELLPPGAFSEKLNKIAETLRSMDVAVFINVRTDPFLLSVPDALEETLRRVKAYEAAGAHGIFVPCIQEPNDIAAVVAATALPVNVMCMPNLPDFNELARLGVKRISMGNTLYNTVNARMHRLAEEVIKAGSFKPLF